MDLNTENRKKLTKWIIFLVAVCTLIFLGVQNLGTLARAVAWCFGLVAPLILGLAIAGILNVPMRFIESKLWPRAKKPSAQRLRRPIAFLLALVIILGILAGVVRLVIPELVDAVRVIVQGAIGFVNQIDAMSDAELAELPLGNILLRIDWDRLLSSLQNWLKEQSGTIMNTAVGTISALVSGVFDFVVAFIFSIYLLFNKEKLGRQITRLVRAWLPESFAEWWLHAVEVAGGVFGNFVSGQTLEALILGTLCMLGMFAMQIPYAPMVGALVGVTALIPVVGAFIGAIVGAFMILTVSPVKAVIFVVFLVVLQQLEGNIVYPRVMGSRVNLPAMWILSAVTIGGGIAGPIGMLLGVPIASTAYVLVREATERREKRLGEGETSAEERLGEGETSPDGEPPNESE